MPSRKLVPFLFFCTHARGSLLDPQSYLSPYVPLWLKKNKRSPGWCGWSWLEQRPANWKIARSILCRGTCLGCKFSPQSGCVLRVHWSVFLSHIDVSPPPFSSLPLSLKSISMSLGDDLKKNRKIFLVSLVETWDIFSYRKNIWIRLGDMEIDLL